MNQSDAQGLKQMHGTIVAAARAAGMAKSTFADVLAGKYETGVQKPRVSQAVAEQTSVAEPTEAPSIKGVATFSLRNISLLSKKPTDTLKGRFYQLRKGIGYKAEDLAAAWHISEDTLMRRATDHHAKAYVEPTPGEFVCVIVHPDTVKEKAI